MSKKTVDENLLKELVSQGFDHSLERDNETSPPQPAEESTGKEPKKRRKVQHRPYSDFFRRRYEVKNRSCIYIDGAIKDKLDRIVNVLSQEGVPLSNFIDNILSDHLSVYEEEINELYRITMNPDKLI